MAKIFRRTCCVIFAIMSLMLLLHSAAMIYGIDYTDEYNVFKRVKSLSTVSDVRMYLQNLKLEYTVTGNSITLKEYKHVSFSVNSDNTCKINADVYMNNFERLDNEDLSVAQINGILVNDNISETITIEQEDKIYSRKNNHYYVSDQSYRFPMTISIFVLLASSITFMVDIILSLAKSPKEKKPKENLSKPFPQK